MGQSAQADLVAVGAELMVTTCPVALFDVTVANLGREDADHSWCAPLPARRIKAEPYSMRRS